MRIILAHGPGGLGDIYGYFTSNKEQKAHCAYVKRQTNADLHLEKDELVLKKRLFSCSWQNQGFIVELCLPRREDDCWGHYGADIPEDQLERFVTLYRAIATKPAKFKEWKKLSPNYKEYGSCSNDYRLLFEDIVQEVGGEFLYS